MKFLDQYGKLVEVRFRRMKLPSQAVIICGLASTVLKFLPVSRPAVVSVQN